MTSKKAAPKTSGNLFLWVSQDGEVYFFKSAEDAFDGDDPEMDNGRVLEVKPIAAYTLESRPKIISANLNEAIERLGA